MVFEICAAIAVFIFAILAYCIYCTLKTLQHTLRNLDVLSYELSSKIRKMDSAIQSISNIGDVAQEESSRFRENYIHEKRYFRERPRKEEVVSDDLADLLAAGLKVGANYLKRR